MREFGGKWPKGPYKWIVGRELHISIPFTWNLPQVKKEIMQADFRYDSVTVGGPAVKLMPGFFDGIAREKDFYPGVLQKVNHFACRTTQGCPNNCKFCGVKRIYPEYRELSPYQWNLNWGDGPIVCDDNFLACSKRHFDRVINELKQFRFVDFNQGLEARIICRKPDRAARLAELKSPIIRLAWDKLRDEKWVIPAIEILFNAGIAKKNIRVYVLIGWQDTPDDALYRAQTLEKLGITINPMRYHPLDAMKRGEYINTAKGWTEPKLHNFMKYWSNKRFFAGIPFADFDYRAFRKHKTYKRVE